MIPTLFIGKKRADVIYWQFCNSSDIWMDYIPDICSYELFEAFQNIIDVFKQYYPNKTLPSICLDDASLQLIKREQLYLSGDSMGLAWLCGLLCRIKEKDFPHNFFAWGAVKPIRRGGFALFPTSNTRQKIFLAEKNCKSNIMLHQAERSYKYFSGETLRLPSGIDDVLKQLEKIIDAD